MEGEVIKNCDWVKCGLKATKHLVFGLRVFDVSNDLHVSEMPYATEHFDLCEKHVEQVKLQYVHVTVFALGQCPNHPDRPNASA